jgi:hypothetical protein
MKRRHIHLSDEQIAALKELADLTGIPLSEIIRRAIDEFIASHTVPPNRTNLL